ncbi:MAG TPA: efflux RND transporter permease subunit, partial [Candidatus Absconditabacterales bacterium]|nr:efflux RND transporter permease subunit [Candidatus Absconditabacterales bacterium]
FDLTFPAMIGIFGVMGVGVNQALIHLEDFKYFYQEKGMSVIDSFQQSIAERFIPIFLTKVTTIIGLLILAVKDELFGSMAIAFIGGLIVSFFITLLYIPSLMNLVSREYYVKNDIETSM